MTAKDRLLLRALAAEVADLGEAGKDVTMAIYPSPSGIFVHVTINDKKLMIWAIGKEYCDRVEDIFTALEQL